MKELLNTLCSPPPDFSVQQAHRAAAEAFGLNGETELLGGERDRNFLQRADGRDVLLKVANPAEPDQLLDFQCAALRHIMRQDPGLPVPVIIKTQDGRDWATAPSTNGVDFRIRAFDFLPGLMLKDAPDDPRLMRNLGKMLARLNRALRGFFHPAANHLLAWDLKRIDSLAELASSISNRSEKEMVRHLLQRFGEEVRPRLSGLRAQVIHNDVSYHNSVVDPEAPFEITGIFDFGDLIYAPLIQDLAVTAAEAAAGRIDPVARCAEIVAGFHGVSPLEDKEFRILPDLVAARLALALLLDSWTGQNLEWEDDREYLVGWRADAASMLGQINDMDPGEFEALLRSACGASPSAKHVQEEQDRAASRDYDLLWQRRLKLLGNANYVAYDRPIHMVRGEGVWLYDAGRKAYLDAYNNVPHVGHCHPRVVAAVARQTATLNTNTRYVYDSLPTYAERLTATLPEGLEVCYFVSSGSEANDLAWRLAKAWTGNGGGLIMQDAYHGVTDAVYELSPIEWNEQRQLSAHIATITAPDDYRGHGSAMSQTAVSVMPWTVTRR